jgi:hypothetical protein
MTRVRMDSPERVRGNLRRRRTRPGAEQEGRLEALEPLAPDLWVASRPLPIAVGDVGARMTVVRSADGTLLLHSPVRLDAGLERSLCELGTVRFVIGPSKVHHLFLADAMRAFPGATLCGAPGLAEKRRDLKFQHVLTDPPPPGWPDEIRLQLVEGAPLMNEVALLHAPSRTLVLTDLVFNVQPGSRNRARLFHRLVGATGRFGPHRVVRLGIRDRRAARRSIDRILGWDFDRIVMSHGDVVPSGGHALLEEAFAFLPGSDGRR